jgi:c-di-GMP-related signal transduction protein
MVFRKTAAAPEMDSVDSAELQAILPPPLEIESVYLGRQPILNRTGSLMAFELLFRDSSENRALITNDQEATATVVVRTIGEVGIAAALGSHVGYLNVNSEVLLSDMILLIPPERFVLEVLETVELDAAILHRCEKLRQHGFKLAFDDIAVISDRLHQALPVADIVKIDFAQCEREGLPELVALLKQHDKVLLAEKVETHDDFQFALTLGFDLFQGYYFAKPQILSSRRASSSAHALLRLLSLLSKEPTVTELESELKLNPNLVVQILRLINSSAFGFSRPISSLRQAVLATGTRQITRWAQLLLFADGRNLPMQADPLIQLAGTRARFMELAAAALHPSDVGLPDSAFMTGIFSLVHIVFGSTIEEIIEMLPLSQAIRVAILEETGELGLLLGLARACETGDADRMALITGQLAEGAATHAEAFTCSRAADLNLQASEWIAKHSRS